MPEPNPSPAAAAPAARAATLAPAPVPAPLADPDLLMNLDPRTLTGFLGRPGLVRRDGPAEVWQYVAAGCVLDVFLYADEGSADFRVAYYELRPRAANAPTAGACFTAMLKAPAAVGS